MNARSLIRSFAALFFLLLIFLMLSLSGCAGISGDSIAVTRTPRLSTPIPPFVATDQAASLQARSTIQAGEAQAFNLSITGTAVSIEVNMQSTQVALQLTQSAATEQYLARRTEIAAAATATTISQQETGTAAAQVAAATGTAMAQQIAATGTAQVATATQAAIDASVRATSTQFAVNELVRRDESQQQTLLFRTWAWRIILTLCFILGIVLIWQATPWVLLKVFGVHSWNGKPVIIVPNPRGGFQAADIARSLGPGLVMDNQGNLLTTGMAADPQIQAAVTARAQAAELLLALREQTPEVRRRVLRQAIQGTSPAVPALPQPVSQEEIIDAQVKILPAGDARVSEWLRELDGKLSNDTEE